jgi:hypothetical protein
MGVGPTRQWMDASDLEFAPRKVKRGAVDETAHTVAQYAVQCQNSLVARRVV